eukprot:11173043-Lingulodinium_polyedra.AAC.1
MKTPVDLLKRHACGYQLAPGGPLPLRRRRRSASDTRSQAESVHMSSGSGPGSTVVGIRQPGWAPWPRGAPGCP